MQKLPAIVIIAYNRLYCLQRLLKHISTSSYPIESVPLVISIDKGDNEDVVNYAQQFEWAYGEKNLVIHQEHLGLKEHVLRCVDLTEEYEAAIVLEDDLLVSPWFYEYALKVKTAYEADENIAGFSLYRYYHTENYYFPFHPLDDGNDVHFIQLPSSWGQMFTARQWKKFREWMLQNTGAYSKQLPSYLADNWTITSWKKHFADYMVNKNLFFVYPNTALSTDYSDAGTNAVHKGVFQVPLLQIQKGYEFKPFVKDALNYDANFEVNAQWLTAQLPNLVAGSLTVDLFGTKKLTEVDTPLLLSSKKCSAPQNSFGNNLFPAIQNILSADTGNFYSLGKTVDFSDDIPERIHFYPMYEAVSNILENSYVANKSVSIARSMFESWLPDFIKKQKESFDLNNRCPLVEILVISDRFDEVLRNTVDHILRQTYPQSQISVTVFGIASNQMPIESYGSSVELCIADSSSEGIKMLKDKIITSPAAYFLICYSGELLFDNALATMNEIFQKYPDVNWLTGIQTITTGDGFQLNQQPTAVRRWNSHIFKKSLYGRTSRYIPSGATFFKRSLWNLAQADLNFVSSKTFCEDLWQIFFNYNKLYTVDAYMSTVIANDNMLHRYSKQVELLETKRLESLKEWLFIRNVPFFRAYYKEYNDLPPVIRYDFKTQSHWLSEY